MACVVTINVPGILPAALLVWRMVFAHRLPVQAVPGYFFRQYPFSPGLVHIRVEQGKRIDGETFYPPVVDLHFAHVKRLSGCDGFTDDLFRIFTRGRIMRFSRYVYGQRIQPGFLLGDSLNQNGRRLLRFSLAKRDKQAKRQSYGSHSFHGVKPPGICVERSE